MAVWGDRTSSETESLYILSTENPGWFESCFTGLGKEG